MSNDPNCHATTIVVPVSADTAVAFLRAPENVGTWALGTWETHPVPGHAGVFVGRSLLDGTENSYFRVRDGSADGTVEYEVGGVPTALTMRVSAKVVPGPDFGYRPDECMITLLGWRPKDMTNERWSRLRAFHEVEILMIDARLRGKLPPGIGEQTLAPRSTGDIPRAS